MPARWRWTTRPKKHCTDLLAVKFLRYSTFSFLFISFISFAWLRVGIAWLFNSFRLYYFTNGFFRYLLLSPLRGFIISCHYIIIGMAVWFESIVCELLYSGLDRNTGWMVGNRIIVLSVDDITRVLWMNEPTNDRPCDNMGEVHSRWLFY